MAFPRLRPFLSVCACHVCTHLLVGIARYTRSSPLDSYYTIAIASTSAEDSLLRCTALQLWGPVSPSTANQGLANAVFGIYEETGKSNTYINNKVIPYPFPVGSGGAREAPLQSALADGFHASGSFIGPTLIGNTFINMGDDGIAIHGRYYLVVRVSHPMLTQHH